MKPAPLPDSSQLSDIKYRISTFIKSFTLVLYVAIGVAVVGAIMVLLHASAGSFIFIFSLIMLGLLFLIQVGLSFFYVVTQIKLALLGAFGSLTLALGFMAIIFQYKEWWGWQVLYLVVAMAYLLSGAYIVLLLVTKHKMKPHYRHFLVNNLLIPYLLILLLSALTFYIDERREAKAGSGKAEGIASVVEASEH